MKSATFKRNTVTRNFIFSYLRVSVFLFLFLYFWRDYDYYYRDFLSFFNQKHAHTHEREFDTFSSHEKRANGIFPRPPPISSFVSA